MIARLDKTSTEVREGTRQLTAARFAAMAPDATVLTLLSKPSPGFLKRLSARPHKEDVSAEHWRRDASGRVMERIEYLQRVQVCIWVMHGIVQLSALRQCSARR